MAISFDSALGMNEAALRLRVARAGVLSSNLANADTPNYKARDINFQEALASKMGQSSSTSMRATHGNHMDVGSASSGLSSEDFYYRVPTQPSIDGNTVEENKEHAEFMKNNMEFQAAFTFLNSKFKGLQKAIRGD